MYRTTNVRLKRLEKQQPLLKRALHQLEDKIAFTYWFGLVSNPRRIEKEHSLQGERACVRRCSHVRYTPWLLHEFRFQVRSCNTPQREIFRIVFEPVLDVVGEFLDRKTKQLPPLEQRHTAILQEQQYLVGVKEQPELILFQ